MFKFSDLSNDLMSKFDLSRNEADAFVASMFEVILDGLRQPGSQVKVKGLGTFKLTTVSSRESVNVNTGERILIGGRDKISFTPETLLKDRVNAPFAQFETVALNDGVDFSELDTEQAVAQPEPLAEEPTAKQPDEPIAMAEEPALETEVPSVEAEEPSAEAEAPTHEAEAPSAKTEETACQLAEPNVQTEEPAAPAALAAEAENESDAPEMAPQHEDEQPSEEATQQVEKEKPTETPQTKTSTAKQTDRHRQTTTVLTALLASVAVLLVVACVGCYFFFSQLSQRDERIEKLEMRIADYAKSPAKPQTTSVETAESVQPKAVESAPQQLPEASEKQSAPEQVATKVGEPSHQATTNQPQQKSAEPAKASSSTKTEVPDQSKYNRDPRIRTGAYAIMGIEKEVTVQAGQTLKSISRAHLGANMECYVEAVNAQKELKVGDKVKIPKLKLKKLLRK